MKGVAKRLNDIAAKCDAAYAEFAMMTNSKDRDPVLQTFVDIKTLAAGAGLINMHAKDDRGNELRFNMDCGISAMVVKAELQRLGWKVVMKVGTLQG